MRSYAVWIREMKRPAFRWLVRLLEHSSQTSVHATSVHAMFPWLLFHDVKRWATSLRKMQPEKSVWRDEWAQASEVARVAEAGA